MCQTTVGDWENCDVGEPASDCPRSSDSYQLQSVGTCSAGTQFIESIEDCSAAAASLNLDDSTASAWVYGIGYPHGCFMYNGYYLYFNDGGKLHSSSGLHISICEGERTPQSSSRVHNRRFFQLYLILDVQCMLMSAPFDNMLGILL
jgi:hypothetical protein